MSLTTTTTTQGTGLVPQSMDQAVALAEMMARSKLVPRHLQGSVGDCFLVVEQATRWKMSPFAVAQCTSVIQGKLMYEGKLVAAAVHTCGATSTRLDYEYGGEGDGRWIVASAVRAGEDKPREVKVLLVDARTENPLWRKQPDQQLSYHAARVWARRWTPEVILGVFAPEEMEPAPAAHSGPTIEARAEPVAEPAPAQPKGRTPADIIATFNAVQTAQDYYAVLDNDGERIAWLKANKPEAWERVEDARKAAAERMEETPPPPPATTQVYDMENAQ